MGLGILDPGVGLSTMARLIGEVAAAGSIFGGGSKTAVKVGNIFLWDNIIRALPAVPPFLEEFARSRVLQAKQAAASAAARSKLPTISGGSSGSGSSGKSSRKQRRGRARKQRQEEAVPLSMDFSTVLDNIMGIMASLTGISSPELSFMESGIDSLGAVQLRNEMASAFGIELAPTVTFDYPTPSTLSSFIAW